MTMCKDLGFDILALSETHKWRSETDAIFSEQTEDGDPYSGCCMCLSKRAKGAIMLNCVKPTHETLFADVPNLSIENATKMSKDRKLWSSNRPSCVANLYQGELQ